MRRCSRSDTQMTSSSNRERERFRTTRTAYRRGSCEIKAVQQGKERRGGTVDSFAVSEPQEAGTEHCMPSRWHGAQPFTGFQSVRLESWRVGVRKSSQAGSAKYKTPGNVET
jgi:hypothetical protein